MEISSPTPSSRSKDQPTITAQQAETGVDEHSLKLSHILPPARC